MRDYAVLALVVVGTLCCMRSIADAPAVQQVMLQGSSAGELAQLVERSGGIVTHDLHIINAVGAKLSKAQLEEVLKSPLITRHIDDLSSTERPEPKPEEESCRVRGHIELDFSSRGFRWPLYNKHDTPAQLERLEMSWPSGLGPVQTLSVGEFTVPPSFYRGAAPGSLGVEFPVGSRPVVDGIADLKVRLGAGSPGDTPPLRQSDFKIVARFVGGCSTDLVPGYDNNHGDFYYNRVAGVEALHREGVTGKGVTVAVIDSGLWEQDALVKDTKGRMRLAARYDALTDTEGQELVDESGHGTHISSIIVNSDPTLRMDKPTGSYKGVAPDATLVAVKVLDRQGLAPLLEIVRAVQWVVDHREALRIRVLNLSIAQTPGWPFWDDPVNQAVERAWASGIAVVAAAGNEGPDPGTIGSPGNLPYIITVGAVTDSWTPDTRDDDYIPDFSSRGPTPTGYIKPDVVALGGHMTGLIHPDSSLALEQPEDMLKSGEFVSTGSSQASALVSGILALLFQLEPDLTPDEIKCKLITSAEPAINSDGRLAYSPFEQGFGYVTAARAVTLGQRECEPSLKGRLPMNGGDENLLGPAVVGENGAATLPGLEGLVSDTPSEKGKSVSRKWGVKDHMERAEAETPGPSAEKSPIDWQELYLREKAEIDRLAREAVDQSPGSPPSQ